MSFSEKVFVTIPMLIVLVLVVDAIYFMSYAKQVSLLNDVTSGWLMWIFWDNRDTLRNQRGEPNGTTD